MPHGSALPDIVDLILAGNGPGELAGWIRPVADAARRAGPPGLRVTLVLSPTQFAGGREPAVARSWGLFDRILEPAEAVRVALGLKPLDIVPQATVVHLGGDLWFSARLARRLRVPACALVETPLVARRHAAFETICATSEDLARRLVGLGVPAGKVVVTGDPRADALTGVLHTPSPSPSPRRGEGSQDRRGEGSQKAKGGGDDTLRDGWTTQMADAAHAEAGRAGDFGHERESEVVSILPGSRDRFARELVPFFLRAADALAGLRPGVTFQVVASPFLSPALVASLQRRVREGWPHLPVRWVAGEPWQSLRHSDLVLTIPGTNTMELALLGVPFAVIVPLDLIDRAPAEGLLEWASRLPGVGRLFKRAAAAWYFRRPRLVALPNIRAVRAVVPEWVGRFSPADLARRVADLLADRDRRAAITADLRRLYPAEAGAADRVAACALSLAAGSERRP
ncbi:MAG: hypothetical protein QN210_11135 [Armatimonadota bacterium]|nr:hypothetical protein [Armatimonadota bacterium]